MTESHIETGPSTTTFVGPDAIKLFQVSAVRAAIDLYLETGMQANRAYTPKAMREFAIKTTGKPYGPRQLAQASADLKLWIEAMKSAMPTTSHE